MLDLRVCVLVTALLATTPALAAPSERRLHSDAVEASSFLWNDWNKFVENYHPNYVADDDPRTAWVEGVPGSGAGEQLRLQLTPLERTTAIRVRIRNGYQKSKQLFAANARAREVTLRLLPSKVEVKATLADKDGWQELTLAQPAGVLRAIELDIRSVYEGARYADLCISDVQVFATSETRDNPAFEKLKRTALMTWRSARMAAAKQLAGKRLDLPLYTAYAVTSAETKIDADGMEFAPMLAAAARDPGFAEFKEALAAGQAVARNLGAMTRAQLAPRKRTLLPEVDGIQVPELEDVAGEEGWFTTGAIRMPLLGEVAVLFADQLRVLDLKDKLTIANYHTTRKCRSDTMWVARARPAEGPAGGPQTVQALVVGRCGNVEGRGGSYRVHALELYVYDRAGRLALVVGHGHVEAYRWAIEGGKPMIVGGRSLLPMQGEIVDITKREPVAAR